MRAPIKFCTRKVYWAQCFLCLGAAPLCRPLLGSIDFALIASQAAFLPWDGRQSGSDTPGEGMCIHCSLLPRTLSTSLTASPLGRCFLHTLTLSLVASLSVVSSQSSCSEWASRLSPDVQLTSSPLLSQPQRHSSQAPLSLWQASLLLPLVLLVLLWLVGAPFTTPLIHPQEHLRLAFQMRMR